MPRDPEMSAWPPERDQDDEDFGLIKALIVGVPLAIGCWLGAWRLVSWILS